MDRPGAAVITRIVHCNGIQITVGLLTDGFADLFLRFRRSQVTIVIRIPGVRINPHDIFVIQDIVYTEINIDNTFALIFTFAHNQVKVFIDSGVGSELPGSAGAKIGTFNKVCPGLVDTYDIRRSWCMAFRIHR